MSEWPEFDHVRITRPAGLRLPNLQPATLDRIPRKGQEVAETAEQLAYRAAYHITNYKRFGDYGGYYGPREGTTINVPGLSARVELVKVVEDDRSKNGYDGEYDQGSEGVIGLIFKVTDGELVVHLKKEGWADSYGEEKWDGPLRIVTPQTKTVTEYVYE